MTDPIRQKAEELLATYAKHVEAENWEPLVAWFHSNSPGSVHVIVGLVMVQLTVPMKGRVIDRDAWACAFALRYREELDRDTALIGLVDDVVLQTVEFVRQDDRLQRTVELRKQRPAPRWHNLRGR